MPHWVGNLDAIGFMMEEGKRSFGWSYVDGALQADAWAGGVGARLTVAARRSSAGTARELNPFAPKSELSWRRIVCVDAQDVALIDARKAILICSYTKDAVLG